MRENLESSCPSDGEFAPNKYLCTTAAIYKLLKVCTFGCDAGHVWKKDILILHFKL